MYLPQLLMLVRALPLSQIGVSMSLAHELLNLESQPGWLLASGSKADTGATGSTGTSTFVSNPDGTATVSIKPDGPYYDCFWFRPCAGVDKSGNKLPTPAPTPTFGYFLYHVEYLLDATNFPLCHALENEARWYDGTHFYQMAWQLSMASKTWRYYDPNIPNWVDSHIPAPIVAGQWIAMDSLFKIEPGVTNLVGLATDGKYTAFPKAIKAASRVTTPWMHTSVQLDSNKAGAPYSCQVRNVGIRWI